MKVFSHNLFVYLILSYHTETNPTKYTVVYFLFLPAILTQSCII